MQNKISKFLQTKIDQGDFPSAVYLVAEKGEIKLEDAIGLAVVEPEKIEAKIDTIYDLASLTKPLITGLICAKLIEAGEINLSDKIAKYFPQFAIDRKSKITIENLLTHTSGFRSWSPFYLFKNTKKKENPKDSVISQITEDKIEYLRISKVIYSDYNFIMLGFLVEKIYGSSIEKIAKKEIMEPLKLENTHFNPPITLKNKIAASELGNYYEKKMCLELEFFNTFYDAQDCKVIREEDIDVMAYQWREHQIWGEVHDANCYFMGGAAGHAGLFSNAFETFKIAQQFLPSSTKLLKPETCKLFRTNFTPDLNQARSIAFQLAETPDSTASEALAKDSFGHLGFTGTSVWIEPEKERIFILLTNRTHNRKLPFADLKETRQNFHQIAAEILDGK